MASHAVVTHAPRHAGNLKLNTLADGLFHASTWVFTVLGVIVIWRARNISAPLGSHRLIGGILTGWGGFNVLEGLIDHHILGVHHVRPGPDELLWDVAFLLWGAVMLTVGIALVRSFRGTRTGRRALGKRAPSWALNTTTGGPYPGEREARRLRIAVVHQLRASDESAADRTPDSRSHDHLH